MDCKWGDRCNWRPVEVRTGYRRVSSHTILPRARDTGQRCNPRIDGKRAASFSGRYELTEWEKTLQHGDLSLRTILRLGRSEHVLALVLASLANSLLLFNRASLASRAGSNVGVDVLASALVQEGLLAILVLGIVVSSLSKFGWRWQYVLACFLFTGYGGLQMAGTFVSMLELVPALQSKGIGPQDYLGSSYMIALGSAVCYLLSILLLRRAYGRLLRVKTAAQAIPAEFL